MKESEYINTTDLAKLRAAYSILGDVHPSSGSQSARFAVFGTLTKWIDDTCAKVDASMEDEPDD